MDDSLPGCRYIGASSVIWLERVQRLPGDDSHKNSVFYIHGSKSYFFFKKKKRYLIPIMFI
jgi:hypothetical protein